VNAPTVFLRGGSHHELVDHRAECFDLFGQQPDSGRDLGLDQVIVHSAKDLDALLCFGTHFPNLLSWVREMQSGAAPTLRSAAAPPIAVQLGGSMAVPVGPAM
jgi:hypothetical protein